MAHRPLSRIWSGGEEVESFMKAPQGLSKEGFGANPCDVGYGRHTREPEGKAQPH